MSEMSNKICVYAICKNESQFVSRWLNSVKNADYIVVLDTGSDDKTYDLFLKYKRYYQNLIVDQKIINPWRFDTARNISLDMAYNTDANIFLCIDLDEILVPGWDTALRSKWVNGACERAVYKYTWSHTDDGSEGRVFWTNKIHSRNWKWIYPVHEILSRIDGNESYNDNEVLQLFDSLHIEHYPDNSKSRSSYLPLLQLRYKENPDDLGTLMYLGHEYYYRGYYENSIDILNKAINKIDSNGIDIASCYLFIGDSYVKLGNIKKAISTYNKSIKTDPTYIEPYIAIGRIYLDQKMYNDAICILKKGLKKSIRKFSWLERDTSWSYEPWDLLSLASFYGGYKKESLIYAVKAYSFDKNNKRLLDNINQILLCTDNSDLL